MTTMRLTQIGTLVRERRGARGVRDAAGEIGVSAATLSRIENGKQPDLLTFEKLCRWLDVSPTEFLDVGATGTMVSVPSPTATAHLRARPQITPQLAQALGEMIVRAQSMSPDDPDADYAE